MNWLIVIIFVVLILIFVKMRYLKHKVFVILVIILLLTIYLTASNVLSGYDINWKSVAGVEKAVKVYFVWLGGTFDNLKVLTANAVKMDWTKKNETSEKIKISEKG